MRHVSASGAGVRLIYAPGRNDFFFPEANAEGEEKNDIRIYLYFYK